MSIEFTREVMKACKNASADARVDFDRCKAARDLLFWAPGHPCCVIDFRDTGGKEALVKKIDALEPTSIVLLGSKVVSNVSATELKGRGRAVLQLGVPYGANQRRNVALLALSHELRDLLTSWLQ